MAASLVACVPVEQQGQSSTGAARATIRYEDFTYDPSIQSVQCYRATGAVEEVLEPAVVSLNQGYLMLEFDRLDAGPQRLLAKLVHCNADWTPSGLAESQYLSNFNEFFLTDVQNSINTRVPYVHYQFRVPSVKLSGNYLLVVQEEGGGLLLTRRLLVYQELVSVTTKLGVPTGSPGQQERQPIEFNVFYNNYELINPTQEVKAIMRQNHRWDTAKRYARPAFVREDVKRLEYVFFEPDDHFLGLSEFRSFDTRSVRYNGIGVANVDLAANPITVDLQTDINRNGQAYSQDPDINGKRLFNIKEYTQGDVSADYTWVDFELKALEVGTGAVYLMGEFTNWRLSNESKLRYDEVRGVYTGKLLLKQGYYNYYYGLKPSSSPAADAAYFEGSHFATNNIYDILIYYRPPGTRADLLIGYEEILFNRY